MSLNLTDWLRKFKERCQLQAGEIFQFVKCLPIEDKSLSLKPSALKIHK